MWHTCTAYFVWSGAGVWAGEGNACSVLRSIEGDNLCFGLKSVERILRPMLSDFRRRFRCGWALWSAGVMECVVGQS